MRRFYILAVLSLVFSLSPLFGQNDLKWRSVANNLKIPWEILWGPDGWIWVTERDGDISRINPDTQERRKLLTIDSVHANNEAGLLGMALWDNQGTIFLYIVYASAEHADMRLVRYRYNSVELVEPTVLLSGIPIGSVHNGSRLVVVEDKLFVTIGDAGDSLFSAPSHTSILGKILRLNMDGSVPDDNPWADAPYPANLLWTTAHRNPQGLVYAPNGILYSSEHGPSVDDEINIIEKGQNYGWPHVTGTCDFSESDYCEDSSVVEPIRNWTPTLAVAGLDYYDADAIPFLKNSLLLTTLKERDLRQLKLSTDGRSIEEEVIYFDGVFGRLRDLCISPTGRVFIATSNRDGRGTPRTGDDRIIELYVDPPVITAPVLNDSLYCADGTLRISFTTEREFGPDNMFRVEVSDENGDFSPGVELGRVPGNMLNAAISTFWKGQSGKIDGYRLRVVSTSPVVISDTSLAFSVASLPGIEIQADSPVLCGDGDTVVLNAVVINGGSDDIAVLWSTGDTTLAITVKDSGTYHVAVTDGNGCTADAAPLAIPWIPKPEVSIREGKRMICEGDSLLLEAEGTGGSRYLWSTGDERSRIYVKESGTYSVEYLTGEGCASEPADVVVTVLPYPDVPEITRQGQRLISSDADAWQWYRDGQPIDDGTGREYEVVVSGNYQVGVKNAAGCETLSESVSVQVSSVRGEASDDDAFSVYPHPVADIMILDFGTSLYGPVVCALSDMEGRELWRREEYMAGERHIEFSTGMLSPGGYVLSVSASGRHLKRKIIKR